MGRMALSMAAAMGCTATVDEALVAGVTVVAGARTVVVGGTVPAARWAVGG